MFFYYHIQNISLLFIELHSHQANLYTLIHLYMGRDGALFWCYKFLLLNLIQHFEQFFSGKGYNEFFLPYEEKIPILTVPCSQMTDHLFLVLKPDTVVRDSTQKSRKTKVL